MAITQTGAMYKSLSFDNTSSRSYGVYITGQAVFNAPERDVEMISIPGRNGAFALDRGRFENITVTYPAGIFAQNEADFAQAISDFRNFLCSKKGYCRLTDEYNPSEYRMAIYKSGLEVEPAQLKAGEFEIVFECMPQRYLTSGETAISVDDGDTLTNPTLYDAKPLLEVKGYGNIMLNNYNIVLNDDVMGEVTVANPIAGPLPLTDPVNTSALNEFDEGIIDEISISIRIRLGVSNIASVLSMSGYSDSPYGDGTVTETGGGDHRYYRAVFRIKDYPYVYAETSSYYDIAFTAHIDVKKTDNTEVECFTILNVRVTKNPDSIVISATKGNTSHASILFIDECKISEITAESTQSILGDSTYIDCDLGQVYKVENDTIVSLNKYIGLGSKLPVLAPGSNTITYDNTITSLKVTPRWWKV